MFSSYRGIQLLVKKVNELLIGDAEAVFGFYGFHCVWIKGKHKRYRRVRLFHAHAFSR